MQYVVPALVGMVGAVIAALALPWYQRRTAREKEFINIETLYLDSVEKLRNEQESRIVRLETEVKELRLELQRRDKRYQDMRDENTHIREENAQLKKDNAFQAQKIIALETELAAMHRELNEMRTELTQVRAVRSVVDHHNTREAHIIEELKKDEARFK